MFSDPFCLSFPFVVRGFFGGLGTDTLLDSGSGDGMVDGAENGTAKAGLSSINSLSFSCRSNKASEREMGGGMVSKKGLENLGVYIEIFYKPDRHMNS